jgi:hypothetical protein
MKGPIKINWGKKNQINMKARINQGVFLGTTWRRKLNWCTLGVLKRVSQIPMACELNDEPKHKGPTCQSNYGSILNFEPSSFEGKTNE